MKKIILVLMLLFSSFSFAAKTVIFSAETKNGKIVEVLKDDAEDFYYYYSFGKKGKPEIVLKCYVGETVFANFANCGKTYAYTLRFINPQAKDYSYQIKKVDGINIYYQIEVFKKDESISIIPLKANSVKGILPDYQDIFYENEENMNTFISC